MSRISNLFFTSKPYSYGGQVGLGILFSYIIKPTISNNEVIAISIISLLMWIYFNWQSDWIQKDEGKARISLPFLAVIIICCYGLMIFAFQNFNFYWLLAYIIPIILYSFKGKKERLAVWGPFFRFVTVMGFSVMISGILKVTPSPDQLIIPIFFALFKATRNLIGDVRDVKKDKHEFPVKFGYSKRI